jgi:hypothetical protein
VSASLWEARLYAKRFIDEVQDADVLQTNEDGIDDPQAREVLNRATKAARELLEHLQERYEFNDDLFNHSAKLRENL